jgi:hypothetical protein
MIRTDADTHAVDDAILPHSSRHFGLAIAAVCCLGKQMFRSAFTRDVEECVLLPLGGWLPRVLGVSLVVVSSHVNSVQNVQTRLSPVNRPHRVSTIMGP